MKLNRREAMKLAISGAVGLAAKSSFLSSQAAGPFLSRRPEPAKRNFTSPAVEAKIAELKHFLGDTELAWLFENCFPNTLDTTVRAGTLDGKPDTFVITGDIPAMWLRDSSAQVWPYVPLAREDPQLRRLLAGVIHRQTHSILIDPYANAFNYDRESSEFAHDLTDMKPELHERKWEIDSLCYPIRLAHGYWKTTGDLAPFDAKWRDAMRLVIQTFREQQRFRSLGPYSFRRNTATPNDTLNLNGYGNPVRPCGLIASGFRPSDDACIYPFLIPSNLFAVTALKSLAEIAASLGANDLAQDAQSLAKQVLDAIEKYGTAQHGKYGVVYAYEVDGFGNQLFMDDANVPSLLSLPYLGCVSAENPIYRNTRRLVLSGDNPYFFRGTAAEGIGGPHVGLDMIWPLAITLRGLTSSDEAEIAICLQTLIRTHAGTGFMHESFHKDDPAKFTRSWFAWANTLFGELVLKIYRENPELLRRAART
ncbi:MAG TPA: glycoside hydrolase family 125 protein [Terriglobales bacterium]|nr:glycoside hydrolase family 125 protein [Terriglobales bacterium]